MKCPGCEKEVPQGSVFCPHCGLRLDTQAHESPGAGSVASSAPVQRAAAGDAGIYTEEELWTGRYSPKAMLGTWFAVGVITLGLIVLGLVIGHNNLWIAIVAVIALMLVGAAVALVRRRVGRRYRLTTQRLILESGLVSLTTDRIDIIDINDITVEQGPIARMLALGTIVVRSNDKTHETLSMDGIEDVNHVADLMDNARRAVQRRRGLRIDVNAPTDGVDHGHPGT